MGLRWLRQWPSLARWVFLFWLESCKIVTECLHNVSLLIRLKNQKVSYWQACGLPGSFQGSLATLLLSHDFVSAVRSNILAGGDCNARFSFNFETELLAACCCGSDLDSYPLRALLIGSCLGAKLGVEGIPMEWIEKVCFFFSDLNFFIQMLLPGPRDGEHLRGRIEGVRQLVEREILQLQAFLYLSSWLWLNKPQLPRKPTQYTKLCDNFLTMSQMMICSVSDWSLSSKMAKIPTLERLYECGEVLANAKGLTHKVFTFTLKFRVWTHFRARVLLYVATGSQGGVWGDLTWCSRRWPVQEAQFAVHWKVGLHFPSIFWKTASQRWDDLFFLFRFFPHFPDLCQQSIDAMLDLCEDVNTMIRMQVSSFLFRCFFLKLHYYLQAIKDMPNLCRDSQIKTLPKIADVLTQLLQVNFSRFEHFAKHFTLYSKLILNISSSRVKTEGKSQW